MNPDDVKFEEADLQKYMSADKEYSEKEWAEYLKARYENVLSVYKSLKLQRDELEARDDKNGLKQLYELFSSNYKIRLWVVKALRMAGVKTEDKHVPG